MNKPDAIAITLFFNACSKLANDRALNLIKQVSLTLSGTINSSPSILPSLFDALIKCSDSSSAERVFRQMKKSALSYANLMSGFNRENQPDKTLKLFDQMKEEGIEPHCAYLSLSDQSSRSDQSEFLVGASRYTDSEAIYAQSSHSKCFNRSVGQFQVVL